jgi:hypothetical protein
MLEEEYKNLNFLKLEGERVKDGNVTISDAKNMLEGIEKSTKYFINAKYPNLSDSDYSVEVRLESGSLVAWVVGIVGAGATAYIITAANQLAKNDVANKNSKQVAKEIIGTAVRGMKTTIKIAKHVGTMGKHTFTTDEAKAIDKENIILKNESGEELSITKDELDTYTRAPKDIFKKLASTVDDDTALFIGEAGETTESDSIARIDGGTKHFFGVSNNEDNEIVFPEWQDGEILTLKGELRRANTNTGTLGFFYSGHTLTSSLHNMEIRDIKDSLFDKEVEIIAKVIRTQKKLDAEDDLKRPKLEIRKITNIGELDKKQQSSQLFEIEAS